MLVVPSPNDHRYDVIWFCDPAPLTLIDMEPFTWLIAMTTTGAAGLGVCVGVGLGVGLGGAVGVGVGGAVGGGVLGGFVGGAGVGLADGEGDGDGEADGEGDGEADSVTATWVGVGAAVTTTAAELSGVAVSLKTPPVGFRRSGNSAAANNITTAIAPAATRVSR